MSTGEGLSEPWGHRNVASITRFPGTREHRNYGLRLGILLLGETNVGRSTARIERLLDTLDRNWSWS